jgi:hypothetical protein
MEIMWRTSALFWRKRPALRLSGFNKFDDLIDGAARWHWICRCRAQPFGARKDRHVTDPKSKQIAALQTGDQFRRKESNAPQRVRAGKASAHGEEQNEKAGGRQNQHLKALAKNHPKQES